MAEKVGIVNLQNALILAISLGVQIDKVSAGGHQFTWSDSLQFLPQIMQIPGIVKNSAAIKAEIADLSDAERQQLNQTIQTQFQISNVHVEAVIKQAANVIEEIFELISVIKTPATATPAQTT